MQFQLHKYKKWILNWSIGFLDVNKCMLSTITHKVLKSYLTNWLLRVKYRDYTTEDF